MLLSPMLRAARMAFQQWAHVPDATRSQAILAMADGLCVDQAMLLEANVADMDNAAAQGASAAMLDRLKLDAARLNAVAEGMRAIAAQPDPLTPHEKPWKRPNGLTIQRVPVPLGVIGMVYESRPNVAADAAAIALKSGNAMLLRGGSDSVRSSRMLVERMRAVLDGLGLPVDLVQMVPSQDRGWVDQMLQAVGELDVIIPRGGRSLTEKVMKESRVPTLLHLDGNCHTYLHEAADPKKALAIVENSKLRRTGICGATESLLVDAAVAARLLPPILNRLLERGCELRGDAATQALNPAVVLATEEDWGTEYLAPILSIKQVDGVEEAVNHIARYGSHHTDAIVTEDAKAAHYFLRHVDSAIVMHNSSTQFADGGEFGFGGEIGIATGRLHARGPVGPAQLVTYKYVVEGSGQVRG